MKVTSKTITRCKKANKDTKYIIYFNGCDADVDYHSSSDWDWCDENTVVDLCNYPYHSEWHNQDVLGFSKVNLLYYKIGIFLGAVLFNIPIIALVPNPIIFIPILVISTLIALGVIVALHKAENYINNNPDKRIDKINNMKLADIVSNVRFYTRSADSVAVGVKRVLDLLEKGVHPDNIILNGFSIGGGIDARVHKIFKDQGIHLRCQINSSFSSASNAITSILRNIHHKNNLIKYGSKFLLLIQGILIRIFNWNIETYKTINSITPYTMFFNNEGDEIIREDAQLVTKVREMEQNCKKKSSQATEDKIFAILFKKHTMLKSYGEGGNTHCNPPRTLRSTDSDINAEDLHYLFTYMPYNVDVLHSRINNLPNCSGNERMTKAIDSLLGTLDDQERNDLKSLLGELKEKSCLTKNQNYSLETYRKGIEKLKKWVEGYNISFVDLANPKTPNRSLIMHTSNPCVQLLNNEGILVN
ncbi:hypothetical protein [Wolbachia endosymbiont of Folsomia candida]|uniref:hypothetical protein n=1 Tax=Wolbachia endosymbiont of Folsomia candida TaxID=169402 RepID=UPI000ABA755D|nr:hypothetical protein [Wolbachia endosymbiont of Folsomia candida]APR98391.1 hypothetical protein ASM33_03830 [Wolbachia endosymbiont of Folsomia candida]